MDNLKIDSEDKERQGGKIVDFLGRINAVDFFERLKSDSELSEKVTFTEFKDFLIRINGIARNIPISNRKFDGNEVTLDGFIDSALVPKQEDKEKLLEQVFLALRHLKHTEDDAYLLPLILNATHPFADGNGRTSRVLHLLLSPHSSSEEMNNDLQKALGEDGRFDCPDINPSYISSEVEGVLLKSHGLSTNHLPDGLTRIRTNEIVDSEGARKFSKKFDADGVYCFMAVYEYLKSKGLFEMGVKTKNDFPDFNLEEDYRAISLNKLDAIFNREDWVNILSEYYKIKKSSVEILIDIFINPDNYKVEGSEVTLRDKLLKEIEEKLIADKL